jgi:hypothetical protein
MASSGLAKGRGLGGSAGSRWGPLREPWAGSSAHTHQGLTLRFQKHLTIGQVQVRFNLPECNVHLPKL